MGAIAPPPPPQPTDAANGQEKPAERRGRTRKAANLAGEFAVQNCACVCVINPHALCPDTRVFSAQSCNGTTPLLPRPPPKCCRSKVPRRWTAWTCRRLQKQELSLWTVPGIVVTPDGYSGVF